MLMKVSPLTSNGLAAPSVKFTGGGRPPRAPVNDWTLVLEPVEAAAVVAAAAATEVVAAGVSHAAASVAAAASPVVEVAAPPTPALNASAAAWPVRVLAVFAAARHASTDA